MPAHERSVIYLARRIEYSGSSGQTPSLDLIREIAAELGPDFEDLTTAPQLSIENGLKAAKAPKSNRLEVVFRGL